MRMQLLLAVCVLAAAESSLNELFDNLIVPATRQLHEFDYPKDLMTPDDADETCNSDVLAPLLVNADEKVVILGGGPAGMTAALYAARADLQPLVLATDSGQLESSSWVDNFPGFTDGVDAVGMLMALQKQAERFGARFRTCTVTRVQISCRPFKLTCAAEAGEPPSELSTSALIVATGARPRWLDVPGEARLLSQGVHTCATCDGAFYRGAERRVAVIGGGDSAMEHALFLARLAGSVTVVHRRGAFRASRAMAARVLRHPAISVRWNTSVVAFEGDEKLRGLRLRHHWGSEEGAEYEIPVDGAFVSIGHSPNTALFAGQPDLKLDDDGYLLTVPGSTRTSVVGVYAAGDVQDSVYRQAVTSAGTGAMAAIDAERWLCEHGC